MKWSILAILAALIIKCALSVSVLDAYNSDSQKFRRIGMLNTRFRPLLHQRGEDDYRTLQAQEPLFDNQDIDENGVFYEMNRWAQRYTPTNNFGRLGGRR